MKTLYSLIIVVLFGTALPVFGGDLDADPEYLLQGELNARRMANYDPNRNPLRGGLGRGFGGNLLNTGLGRVIGGGRSKAKVNVNQTGFALQTTVPLLGRVGFAKQWSSLTENYTGGDTRYERNAGNGKGKRQKRESKQRRPTAAEVREHIRQIEENRQLAIERDAPEETIQALDNELVQARALLRKIEGPAAVSTQPTRRAPSTSDTGVTRRRNPIPDPAAPADEGDEEEE